ncbi:MAG TPA: hypothetical protein VE075_11085 [Thermoanaerobaculia bacterium]|nr:hypothetical protein [Thermoanaerobaculia bacterium]
MEKALVAEAAQAAGAAEAAETAGAAEAAGATAAAPVPDEPALTEMFGKLPRYVRVERDEDVPAPDPRAVDVAVLDMNHGWPNLGHDSLVYSLLDGDPVRRREELRSGLFVRVLSYDVRRRGMVPEPPSGGRFAIYVGTGGPGHIDPACNDGLAPGSQGLREDARWEPPLFRLFASILDDPAAALLAVCHSFGVLCRWTGIARPRLRGPGKGGKSSGVLENVLTAEAAAHPWFGRFARPGRLRILDNRLFDLIEEPRPLPRGAMRIGYEPLGVGGPPGEALTMLELARDAGGVMPRVFAVNHHPEVVERARQLQLLERKLGRGEVSAEWVAERREILTRTYPDEDSDSRLQRTSECTLLGPLRFFVYRELRRRAAALRLSLDLHEDQVLRQEAPATA